MEDLSIVRTERFKRFSNHKWVSLITKITDFLNSTFGEWATLLLIIIGLVIGFFLVIILLSKSPTVSISNSSIVIDNGLESLTFIRDEIQEIYYDEDELVIVGTSGHELLRESYDIRKETLKNAFRNYSYPFSLIDPYKTCFKLWSASTEELSTAANALMKARALAIKNKEKDEIIDISDELSKLGVIVKDDDTKQYWRFVTPNL
ncbi:hypothetical protein [Solibacillus sp. CAU 1738]|uniref:YqeB family protein n=1 Tax=Solibacillus sp. CAU 1738 TaxID=3140363 RepID=UPI003260E3F6